MAISLPKVTQKRKRLGRGIGSSGAKSGRGQKGQKARAGYTRKAGFEGGQTPLYMRLPKGRGTKQWPNSRVRRPVALNVTALNQFEDKAVVGPGVFRKAGMLEHRTQTVKLVGDGEVTKNLTVRAHGASKAAVKSIEAAGGKVEIITK